MPLKFFNRRGMKSSPNFLKIYWNVNLCSQYNMIPPQVREES